MKLLLPGAHGGPSPEARQMQVEMRGRWAMPASEQGIPRIRSVCGAWHLFTDL
jgi:hypothetical protein